MSPINAFSLSIGTIVGQNHVSLDADIAFIHVVAAVSKFPTAALRSNCWHHPPRRGAPCAATILSSAGVHWSENTKSVPCSASICGAASITARAMRVAGVSPFALWVAFAAPYGLDLL
jgi:hypothetical protein